jgi:hypothetical protein
MPKNVPIERITMAITRIAGRRTNRTAWVAVERAEAFEWGSVEDAAFMRFQKAVRSPATVKADEVLTRR